MIDYFFSQVFFESIIAVVIGIALLYVIRGISRKILKKKSKNKGWEHSVKLIFDFLSILVIIVTALSVLSINGINVGKYFASLGIAGIAIGFAAQDLLKDWIMGLSIILENYYKMGDVVVYKERYGKIISFNIKTTKIKMLDDESLMTVPNRNITEIAIASDWFDLDIPLGYDVDLYYARFICKECCKRIERLKYVYSADFINTQSFEDSWVVYRVRVHCMNEKRFPLKRAANAVVQDVFHEQGIGFPYSVKIIQNVDPNHPNVGSDFIKHKSKDEIKEYNKVYELGSGAVKSKHKTIDKTDVSIKQALDEAERYASSENLDKKMRLKIRLLSEEILSLTKHITTIEHGDFYIERNSDDYEIHFDADVKMDIRTKETLMGIASDGKNEAYSGAGGSILNAIDSMVLMMNTKDHKSENSEDATLMEKSISSSDGDYRWSLNIFNQRRLEEQQNTPDAITDTANNAELSVLNNMADDVHISVKGNHISITILVSGRKRSSW